MDGAAIYRREEEIGLLLLKNRPPNSGVTYPLCFKPSTGLGLPSGTRQQQKNICPLFRVRLYIVYELYMPHKV